MRLKIIFGFPYHILQTLRRMVRTWSFWIDPIATFRFYMKTMRMDRPCADRTSFRLRGRTFQMRPMDWNAFEEIAMEGEYDFIHQLLRGKNDVVVDLGANVGLFSLIALSLNPTIELHAVEADPQTHDVLKSNAAQNSDAAWKTYQVAISKSDGSIRFAQTPASTSGHVALPNENGIDVPALSWKTFFSRHLANKDIAVLKVDIEGAEGDVLKGPSADFSRVANIVVEIHPYRCDEAAIMNWLRADYAYIYAVAGRRSQKPLILASRAPVENSQLRPA